MNTQPHMGGGTYRPATELIFHRLSLYIHRRLCASSAAALPAVHRQRVVYTLWQHFEQRPSFIARRLAIPIRTVYRDISAMKTLVQYRRAERQAVAQIREYILYNAQYVR